MLDKSSALQQRIPQQAIANDNFIGFVSSFWHEHQPRWIELAAATPVWTSLMAFYVEGDKGHLMNNQARRAHTSLCFFFRDAFHLHPQVGIMST